MTDPFPLDDDPNWYSDAEAQKALGVDPVGLQSLVDDGTLAALKWQGRDDERCFDAVEVEQIAAG